ncbi:hypothetical protein NQ315_012157 [Exocentrus adspersus]|uniref:Non-structural maintenance of chromosomes element 1 homolog n=1 Tax=Exocentrus adspersus TaxID=1586481 RepID=A0AAV8VXT0_9CUCU|nr:hypothetical protein NQ315_012157 [Exocentrus adspersus]
MDIYHKYFVQYMLKNGVSSVDDALSYCKYISKGKIETMTQLKTLIIELNREISKQFYKLVLFVCEVTNRNMVVWLNTKNDDISKYQIAYSPIELEYFQAILQEILHSEDHRITFIVCINITSTLTAHFSRDSGQKVLNKWLKGGYYIKKGDFIHLGPRTILEFTAFLRANCPDSICNLCSEIVFTGSKCYHCDKVLHSYCLSTYLSTQSICPCCKNDWVHVTEENENYSMDADDTNIVEDTMCVGEEVTLEYYTESQPGDVSPVLQANRRNLRNRHDEDDYLSYINEPGPSTRKRFR